MAYVGANYGYMILGNVVSFFRRHDALSVSKAISMTSLDWAESGMMMDPTRTIFNPYKKFIKKTNDGKYWLDVQGFEQYQISQSRNIRIFMFAMGIFMLGSAGIATLIGLSSPDTTNWSGAIVPGIFLVVMGVIFIVIGLSLHPIKKQT